MHTCVTFLSLSTVLNSKLTPIIIGEIVENINCWYLSIIFIQEQKTIIIIIIRVRDHYFTILLCRCCFIMIILFPSGERDENINAVRFPKRHLCCATNSFTQYCSNPSTTLSQNVHEAKSMLNVLFEYHEIYFTFSPFRCVSIRKCRWVHR